MKINWFSPLPPAKTDIAEYTIRLLPGWVKNCQIELWTNQTIYDQEISRYVKVNFYQIDNIPWKKINQADLNIYNIGNNRDFHQEIWQIGCRCPGLVILHDLKLHHFFSEFYRHNNDQDGYVKQMRYYYGIEGETAAQMFWIGEIPIDFMVENYPLTPLALKNSLGVISHSQETYKNLQQENFCLSSYIPLPYPSRSQLLIEEPKDPQEFYQLIIFGHISTNRCLDIILESLAKFPQKQSFRLDIYGEIWDVNYIRQCINQLGLDSLVTLHGFVPETELEIALAKSDLAINLRYPTMGEASGSQLRIWSHALPSLVTKIGWYEELPKDTVAYVRFNHEIEDIHQHLSAFLGNPEMYKMMGINGQSWLESHHNPELCVHSILDFAQEICQRRYSSTANYFIERVGREVSYWSDENPSDIELKALANAIYYLTTASTSIDKL